MMDSQPAVTAHSHPRKDGWHGVIVFQANPYTVLNPEDILWESDWALETRDAAQQEALAFLKSRMKGAFGA